MEAKIDGICIVMQKFYLEPLPLDVQLLKLFISLRADASVAHMVPLGTHDLNETNPSAPPVAALIHTHRINFPDFEFIEPPNKKQGFLARQVNIRRIVSRLSDRVARSWKSSTASQRAIAYSACAAFLMKLSATPTH